MKITYDGNNKFNIYQNNKYIGRLSKKHKEIEVNEGEVIIKEVITGITLIDFILYFLIGFYDIFGNYVDSDVLDYNICLITAKMNVENDVSLDNYGLTNNQNHKIRKGVFLGSIICYTVIITIIGFLLLDWALKDGSKEIIAFTRFLFVLSFISYFYISVNLITTFMRYKKFLIGRIGDINGK